MVKEAVSPVMLTAGFLRKLTFWNLSRDCHHGKTRCHHINKVEQKKSDPPWLENVFAQISLLHFMSTFYNLHVISTCSTHHYRSCSSLISNVSMVPAHRPRTPAASPITRFTPASRLGLHRQTPAWMLWSPTAAAATTSDVRCNNRERWRNVKWKVGLIMVTVMLSSVP